MSRKNSDDAMSDAQWNEFRKALYERKRLKPAMLRQAERARRKAGEVPPTLWELIERHIRERPRARRHTLGASSAPATSVEKLAAIFTDDPVLTEIGEAAALTSQERFAHWGWLVGLPFGVVVPDHMLAESYRW